MSNYWKETAAIAKQTGKPTATKVLVPTNEALVRKSRTSATCAWALAGISAYNLGLAYFEAPIRFAYGFEVTEVLFELGRAISHWLVYPALVLDLAILAAVVFLGFQAKRLRVWAHMALLALLVADTAILVWFAWINGTNRFAVMMIHLLLFAFLWEGLRSAKLYARRKQTGDA